MSEGYDPIKMCAVQSGESICRISARDLTADEFVERYVAENTPVILEDAFSEEWARALAWTPEHFVKAAPQGSLVRVAPLMADGRDKWIESAELWPGADEVPPLPGIIHADRVLAVAAARVDVTIEDFAASLRGEGSLPSLYADGASNLENSFSFLTSDLPAPPKVGASLHFKKADVWLGGKTLSTLHYDNCENLFAQLVGDKEFLLCPPGDTGKLVDGRLRKAYAKWCEQDGSFQRCSTGLSDEAVLNYAAYDITNPPKEYAERAAKLRCTLVRVRQGELFYLPFGWWHQVRGIPAENGLCASVSQIFEPFFVRLQPKALTKPGPLLPNPKYRSLCERLHLGSSSDEEEETATAK